MTRPRHEHLEADLSAYLDGELDAARTREVEALLTESEDARRSLEALRGVRDQLVALPRASAPATLASALARQAAQQTRSNARRIARRAQVLRLFRQFSAAAALVLATVFVSWHVFTRPAATVPAPVEQSFAAVGEKGMPAHRGVAPSARADVAEPDRERLAAIPEIASVDDGPPARSKRVDQIAAKPAAPATVTLDVDRSDVAKDVDGDGVAESAGTPVLAAASKDSAADALQVEVESHTFSDLLDSADSDLSYAMEAAAPDVASFGQLFATTTAGPNRASVVVYVTPTDAGGYVATKALVDSWSAGEEQSLVTNEVRRTRGRAARASEPAIVERQRFVSATSVRQATDLTPEAVYMRIRQVLDTNPRQAVRVETNVDAGGTDVLLAVAQALAAERSESFRSMALKRSSEVQRLLDNGTDRRAGVARSATRTPATDEGDSDSAMAAGRRPAMPQRRTARRAPAEPPQRKTQRPVSPPGFGLPEQPTSQPTDAAQELLRLAPLSLGLDQTVRLYEWLMGTSSKSAAIVQETPTAASQPTALEPPSEVVSFRIVLLPPNVDEAESQPALPPTSAPTPEARP